jgi:Na+-transporting NADH:ubiquinone oxidoreductase subunit NqrF
VYVLFVCRTAKNVMLAGVKAVTLHDEKATVVQDLGGQFYLTEADVGVNRASACAARVQELNSAVAVEVSTAPITDAFLGKFSVRAPRPACRLTCPTDMLSSTRSCDPTSRSSARSGAHRC